VTPTSEPHPAALAEEQLLADCTIQFTRRSGPGGQHRNKVETAVVLTHKPSGIRAEASERRSQAENRAVALQRLREELAVQLRTAIDKNAEPSGLWRTRAKGRKLNVSTEHADFPALLAEALDRTAAHEFELTAAAESLGISTTQLARFLQQSPVGWQWVNGERQSRNLRPLR
jgi:protein subunit release factor B